MKEKIYAFLKTKLNGVPDAFVLGVAEHYAKSIKEDKEIETTLTDGVIDLLKLNAGLLQAEGDKRATEAAKTALKNYQEKHGLDENGKPIEDPAKKKKKEVDSEEPAWFKVYREEKDTEYAELKSKLENQEKEKAAAALADKVKGHEKMKDIPASFLKGRNLIPKSEAEINQLVLAVEADYNGFKQEMAEKGVVISVPPAGGGAPKEGEAMGKKIAEKKNTNSSDGVKGKAV